MTCARPIGAREMGLVVLVAAALAILLGGLLAGLGGAWSAVARHLAAIQPKV